MTTLLIAAPLPAQDDGALGAAARAAVRAAFTELERRAIEQYYAARRQSAVADEEPTGDRGKDAGNRARKGDKRKSDEMPPGLARRGGDLPPGLARRLEAGGELPPGLAKRALPEDLEARLPAPPPGTERVVVDGDVVLVDATTGVIRDIMHGVAR